MKRIILFLTTILLVLGNLAYGGGMPFTGSVDWTDVEGKNASGLPFDNTTAGFTGNPDDVQAALEAAAAAITNIEAGGLSGIDAIPGDTVNDEKLDSSLINNATSTGLGVSMFSNSDFLVTAGGLVSVKPNVFEPADATILKSAAIGVTVQGYDAILAALAGLANSSGILTNDGNGNLSWGAGTGSGDMLAEDYPNIVAIDAVTPSVGYLHWNGSAYVYDTPSGSEHDAVTLGASLANILTLTGQELGLGTLGATLGSLADTSGVTPSQYWGSDALGAMGYHDLPVGGDLVSDTTPQLGGDLDVNGKEIQSAGNIVFQLGDNAGTNKLSIQDSDGNEIWQVNSNGESGVATAAPHLVLQDSDNLGADEECARIEANATTTTDGSEDGYISISPMRNGSPTEVARFDPDLAADLAYSGVVRTVTAGENLAFGDLVYLTTSTGVIVNKADADASTSVGDLFICLGTINDGSSGLVLVEGFIRHDTWNWTSPGLALYVSTSVGTAQEAAPSGSGDQVQKIGYSWSADIIHFKPSIDITEVP
jgi:hypothetical protein